MEPITLLGERKRRGGGERLQRDRDKRKTASKRERQKKHSETPLVYFEAIAMELK